MKKYRNLINVEYILDGEPEWYLAYLFGPYGARLPKKKSEKPATSWTLIKEVISHIKFLLRKTHRRKKIELPSKNAILFFYCSENQRVALAPTAVELAKFGYQVQAVYTGKKTRNILADWIKSHEIKIGAAEGFFAIYTSLLRTKALFRFIRENRTLVHRRSFAQFLRSHVFLSYFTSMLHTTKPTFIIMSNDHNTANRCLLAAARHIGTPTAYMQHASVSNFFPALRFDYAFLDGNKSYSIYKSCEKNRPPHEVTKVRTEVFLTGQKKPLTRRKNKAPSAGIAVNNLDNIRAAISLAQTLAEQNMNVVLRWHPTQKKEDINAIQCLARSVQKVELSDPSSQNIDSFLQKIHWLIAGDSGVHLEAALAGIASFYMNFGDTPEKDYYGFVNAGISMPVSSAWDFLEFVSGKKKIRYPPKEALQEFSATFGTAWEGHEGLLTAQYIKRILEGE